MKNIIKKFIFVVAITTLIASCTKDLNQTPIDPDSFTQQDVFANATVAKGALAKLYTALALTGQQGPAGQPDILGIDEGFSQYSRMLFMLNVVTTDEAVIGWGDPGVPDMHAQIWSSSNAFTVNMYSRIAQEVSFSNSFIKNASLLTGPDVDTYVAEARFLRAFAYYNLMDLYANVPLTTTISTDLPLQSNRTEIFAFVESELLAIQDQLMPSGANEYGRVDQVAAWALLSKLYLNAEVWTGTPKYNECVTYSEKVMNSSYTINTNDANGNGSAYDELFLADNNTNGAQNEFIFELNFDGNQSQTYGGTTFLVHAAIGGSMDPAKFGVNGGWGGLRTTKNLVEKFTTNIDQSALNPLNTPLGTASQWGLVGDATINSWDGPDMTMYETATNQYAIYATLKDGSMKFRENNSWNAPDINYGDTGVDGSLDNGGDNIAVTAGTYYITMDLDNLIYTMTPLADKRGMFHTDGQSLEIASIPPFKEGYAVAKFKNIRSDGNPGNDSSGNMVDTDLPLIRLPEIYLNYAEATLRGGGGDLGLATSKINELRERAYGSVAGDINSGALDLNFVLDERSRELYWEGQRRTDLVRYNYFTTDSYLWPFKGNQPLGASVASFRNIFPIPTNIISINTNMQQNPGY